MTPVAANTAYQGFASQLPRNTSHSPTKPDINGRPMDARVTIISRAPYFGITAQMPPNSEISRVCLRS